MSQALLQAVKQLPRNSKRIDIISPELCGMLYGTIKQTSVNVGKMIFSSGLSHRWLNTLGAP